MNKRAPPAALLLLLLLLQLHLTFDVASGQAWDGKYTGASHPDNWAASFPTYCTDRRQTPIDLAPTMATFDPSLREYTFNQPNMTGKMYKLNNYGTKLDFVFDGIMTNISFGGDTCYRPYGIHWHWGSDNSRGSEHTFGGMQYPLEGHIVMWNCKYYSTFGQAASSVEGLAVLGTLFQESATQDTTTPEFNSVLDALLNSSVMRCPTCDGSNYTGVTIPAFDVKQLLPANRSAYYMYIGSLTTPPCTPNVLWTVYRDVVMMPPSRMSRFRALMLNDGNFMSNNYRPILALNPTGFHGANRVVTRSFFIDSDIGGAGVAGAGLTTVSLLALLAIFSVRL